MVDEEKEEVVLKDREEEGVSKQSRRDFGLVGIVLLS